MLLPEPILRVSHVLSACNIFTCSLGPSSSVVKDSPGAVLTFGVVPFAFDCPVIANKFTMSTSGIVSGLEPNKDVKNEIHYVLFYFKRCTLLLQPSILQVCSPYMDSLVLSTRILIKSTRTC